MPYVSTPHTDAQVMNWAQVLTNLNDIRAWVNDIPAGDVSSSAIRREHLVRPILDGGFYSPFQRAADALHGVGDADALTPSEWGGRKGRLIIVPKVNEGTNESWYTPIGRTFYLPVATWLEAHVTLEWQTRGDPADPRYPDGAGGPAATGARGGFWALHVFDRATQTDTWDPHGIQHIYPVEDAAGVPLYGDRGHVMYNDTLEAGAYDITLVYHRGGAPDELDQIDVGQIHLNIEGL